MQELLTNENFIIYAARHYDNLSAHGTAEFYEDLKRFKYIKKLVTRYLQMGILKERLILNHVIVLNNVFGPEPLVRMLFLRMPEQMRYIKPFLVMLSIMPDFVMNIGKQGSIIKTDEIDMDVSIVEALRRLRNNG